MSENVETLRRICPTCEACCGLVTEVDRDQQKILSIHGDPDDQRSKGYVCAKSQAFNYIYEDPERLRHPVKKTDDGWEEISWEQAFDTIAEKFSAIREEYGKDARFAGRTVIAPRRAYRHFWAEMLIKKHLAATHSTGDNEGLLHFICGR